MRPLILSVLFPALASASTTVNVNAMDLDGLAIRDVHCVLSGGGLFASLAVGAQLASQADAFNACHPAGAAVRLAWTWEAEQLVSPSVVSSSGPASDPCMIRALRSIRSPLSGTCETTFLVGDTTAAEAAYTLSQAPSPSAAPSATPPSPAPTGKTPVGKSGAPPSPTGK